MITFKKQPIGKLDVKTKKLTGIPKPTPPVNIGMDTKEFHGQVMDLHKKGVPIHDAFKAIDKHPDIQDKARAKSMAHGVYKILDASQTK